MVRAHSRASALVPGAQLPFAVPKTWQAGAPDNVALLLFFLFWYVGNAFYNQYNTMALEGECAQTQDLVGLGLGAVPCDLQAPAASTAA